MNIFEQTYKSGAINFLSLFRKHHESVDIDKFMDILRKENRYVGYGIDRSEYFIDMERRWYESLKEGNAGALYSIYNEEYYSINTFLCWAYYSRKYILNIRKLSLSGINTVIDVGCGIGYSTAALKTIFPEAEVYGTQLESSLQYPIVKDLAKQYGFEVHADVAYIGKKVNLVFASEYFEHFSEPIEHLEYIYNNVKPDYLVIANAFNTISLGHFIKYYHEGKEIDQAQISRKFLAKLKELGYEKINTGFWNNRPMLLKHKSL